MSTTTLPKPLSRRAWDALCGSPANLTLNDLVARIEALRRDLDAFRDAHGPAAGCRCPYCRQSPHRWTIDHDLTGLAWTLEMAVSSLGGMVLPTPDEFEAMAAKALAKSGCQASRSEEHTSELQSHSDLVCRLLLEKKKKMRTTQISGVPHREFLVEVLMPFSRSVGSTVASRAMHGSLLRHYDCRDGMNTVVWTTACS